MRVAISADCFSAYTSGFPVRGMTLALIKGSPEVEFVLLYTRRNHPVSLRSFYEEINSQKNVQVRYFNESRRVIALKRMLTLRYVKLDDCDCFLNPGNIEYIRGFKGVQICSLADLSTLKGLSTYKYAFFFKYWNRFYYRYTLPKLTRIVTISNFTRNDLLGFYPNLNEKTLCIYNGIDSFWLDEKLVSVDYKCLGIDSPYFIWWGLMSRRKNIYNLIEAYKLAKKQVPELPKLLLVGKVSEYMIEITKEFNADIINIPFQDNYTLKTLVGNSAGLIFPSLYEGFGLPVIEAFSQGVNVACSNVTSLPEIADGHAILFDPNNTADMQQAIIKLYHKNNGKEELINYATRFSYVRAAAEYMKLIRGLQE